MSENQKSHVKNVDNIKKYFEILELTPEASFSEVKNAYQHLKRLYSSEPLVLSPIIDEIPEEKRLEIVKQLEDAFDVLKKYFSIGKKQKFKIAKQRVANHNVPEFEVFNGNALKLTREVLGIELKEIALFSGIPERHLKNIELEKFDQLPPKGYIKVFLRKYAEYLSLDAKKIIHDYFRDSEK
ncbi:MAG: hypothetical protein GY757_06410 [bacterium]|nr:hypothetical protein [bacterium]